MQKCLTTVAFTAVLLFVSTQKLSAQYYFYDNAAYDTPLTFELGGSLGVMNCLTDIGGKKGIGKPFIKDLNIGNTQLNGSVYLSALYKEKFAIRLEGTFGQIKAYDSILKKVRATTGGRYERNLSFRSHISEISLIAEFHPLFIFIDWQGRDQDPPRLSPYLATGIGYYSFNPQTQLTPGGKFIDLQPLSTEGQGFAEYPDRKPYKLRQFNVPVGIGAKYDLSPSFNIRAEFMLRLLFTDYLDDCSTLYIDPTVYQNYFTGEQLSNALALNMRNKNLYEPFNSYPRSIRGDPTDRDSYFTFNIKLGMVFGREKR